jgi:hypothetical protein
VTTAAPGLASCDHGSLCELAQPPARSARLGKASRMPNKLWCHLYLEESMLRPGFDFNKKIIGHGGCCTRAIFDATGAKIRLRGHGSKHLEGGREAPVHLMLAVTTEETEPDNFRKAVEMAEELLRGVEVKFQTFCQNRSKEPTAPKTHYFWIGELSTRGKACLGSLLERVPYIPVGKEGTA